MLSLTRTISSGLTGLSASGLSLYFVPKYFEDDSQSSKLIYEERQSRSGVSIKSFEKREDSILKDMEELYSKFKEVSKHLQDKKGEKYNSLQVIFQKVDAAEEVIRKLYEENKSFLNQIGQITDKTFQKQKEKLNAEARIKQLNYFNESMNQVNDITKSWKDSVQKIICAIDSSNISQNCGSNTQSFVSGGGQTPSSQKAIEQLESSKKEFLWSRNDLILRETLISKKITESKQLEGSLTRNFESLKHFVIKNEKWSGSLNTKMNEKLLKSHSETAKLNSLYKDLKEDYGKWEKLKKNSSSIWKYLGIIKSHICNNYHKQGNTQCFSTNN